MVLQFLYARRQSQNGPVRWRLSILRADTSSTADRSSGIRQWKGVLYAIKTTDGTKHGNLIPKSTVTLIPTLANKVVYYEPKGVHAINAETGALIWENTSVGSAFSSLCAISKTGEIFHSGISGIKN